jgi:hypothetical protein
MEWNAMDGMEWNVWNGMDWNGMVLELPTF